MAEYVTSADFDEVVLGAQEPVLVDFFATWCGPCNMLSPVIEEVADEIEGKGHVFKLDIDENPDIAQRYRVTSVPTLMLFKGGEPVAKKVGVQPKYDILAMFQ